MANASRGCTAAVIAMLVSMFINTPAAAQATQVPYSNGFENGIGAFSWTTQNSFSLATSGCHTGARCAQFSLPFGPGQQESYVARDGLNYNGQTLTVSAWWKFPTNHSWRAGGPPSGCEHKMMVVNTVSNIGRILVNLRDCADRARAAVHFEQVDPYGPGQGITQISNALWPNDGQWHQLAVEVTRRPGNAGRVRLFLDQDLVVDRTGNVCGAACSPIRDVQWGALINQGSPKAQTWFVDDVLISNAPHAPGGVVTPPPPPGDRARALEAIAGAAQALGAAQGQLDGVQAKLEEAIDALDQQ